MNYLEEENRIRMYTVNFLKPKHCWKIQDNINDPFHSAKQFLQAGYYTVFYCKLRSRMDIPIVIHTFGLKQAKQQTIQSTDFQLLFKHLWCLKFSSCESSGLQIPLRIQHKLTPYQDVCWQGYLRLDLCMSLENNKQHTSLCYLPLCFPYTSSSFFLCPYSYSKQASEKREIFPCSTSPLQWHFPGH